MNEDEAFQSDLEEEDNEIAETMTEEQFQEYFHENKEINYKGFRLGILDLETGKYEVITPDNSDDGFTKLNENSFDNACDAINFAAHYLVEYDTNPEEVSKKAENKKNKSKKKESKAKTEVKKEVKIEEYNGPKVVRVFGRDIYIEEDPNASSEDIRTKLVTEYNFPNFSKEKMLFDFDESTGVLEVGLKFNSKG